MTKTMMSIASTIGLQMPATSSNPPMLTFAEVQAIVTTDESTPDGTRKNILRAVDRVAQQMGGAGLQARIDIAAIQRKFEKITPAMLGFKSAGSLASMMSNFRRGLRLAGVSVMPGKSHAPLSAAWAALREAAEPLNLWPALSRFAHFCAAQSIEPDAVGAADLARFVDEVRGTSLKSRGDKMERQIARAWKSAQARIPVWPSNALPMPARKRADGTPDWSAYLPSLATDASAFVNRGDAGAERFDFLSADDRKPLREATMRNYLGALRRAAGELVAAGVPAEELRTLVDLVRPDRAEIVLRRLAQRTRRQKGGHIEQMAIVLFLVGRDHVRLPEAELAKLEKFARLTRGGREMGQRTARRLEAMSDSRKIDELLRLPDRLVTIARKREKIDAASAGHVRAALFLNLLFDTGARQGNVVGLDLAKHLVEDSTGRISIIIPGEEVKNGEEIWTPIRPRTARILRLYRDTYRIFHAGGSETTLLFPRSGGSHWPTTAANRTLQDLTAKHIGFPVNPHLIRALVGEIIEEEHPGAIGMAKDVLGHKLSSTTETYYRGRKVQRARRHYHAALDRRVLGR